MGWLRERWRFVTAAEREGVAWFVGVWRFMAPLVAIAAFAGVGAWITGRASLWPVVGCGVAFFALLFAEGAFRLWRDAAAVAFPVFPRHRLDLGNPMYLSGEGRFDDFILFDLTFTNQSDTTVALTVGLFWEWERTPGQIFGPHSLSPVKDNLGALKVLDQPAAVGPHLPYRARWRFPLPPRPGSPRATRATSSSGPASAYSYG
jgi:hypothetical protein